MSTSSLCVTFSLVTTFFFENVVTLFFGNDDMINFPLTLSSKLIDSRHRSSTQFFSQNSKRFLSVRLSTLYQRQHVQFQGNLSHCLCSVVYFQRLPESIRFKMDLSLSHKNPLTLINQPVIQFFFVSLYHSNPIHLATIGLLRKSNEGGARLPQDFRRIQLNVFNQLLSPHLMGFLGLKDV